MVSHHKSGKGVSVNSLHRHYFLTPIIWCPLFDVFILWFIFFMSYTLYLYSLVYMFYVISWCLYYLMYIIWWCPLFDVSILCVDCLCHYYLMPTMLCHLLEVDLYSLVYIIWCHFYLVPVSGYMKELTFQHTDGSFSAFGNRDPSGSMWWVPFRLPSISPFTFVSINPHEHLDSFLFSWINSYMLLSARYPVLYTGYIA